MSSTTEPILLPRRLIEAIPDGKELVAAGAITIAPKIDGWEWERPTVIYGKRYDWWVHDDGRHRLAPSLLDAYEHAIKEATDARRQ